MKRYAFFVLGAALLLRCSFPNNNSVAGTSNETQTVVGKISYSNGNPVDSAEVILRNQDSIKKIALTTLNKTLAIIHSGQTKTDANGLFRFDSVDTGRYYLEVNYHDSLGAVQETTVNAKDTIHVNCTVKLMGAIEGKIDTGFINTTGKTYVYVVEVQQKMPVDSTKGTFEIGNLPPYNYTLQILHDTSVVKSPLDIAKVPVKEGDTTHVGNTSPVVLIGVDTASGTAPLTIKIIYKASDPDGDTVAIYLSYGDGKTDTLSTASGTKTHTYADSGTFKIVLMADDRKAGIGRDSVIVKVTSQIIFQNGEIKLIGGSLAGQTLDSSLWQITVAAGARITGSVQVQTTNSMIPSAVAPFGYTWTWGKRDSSIVQVNSSIPVGSSTWTVPFDQSAPFVVGTYYILFGFEGEYNLSQVFSCTNWTDSAIVWNDGNDYFDMSDSVLTSAHSVGYASSWKILFKNGFRLFDAPVAPIKVIVKDSSRILFAKGDTVIGWQYSTFSGLYTMNPDGSSQIQVHPATANAGQARWSMDREKITFCSNEATTGSFEVFVMNSDGAGVKQVTHDSTGNNEMNPCFRNAAMIWYVNMPTRIYAGVIEIYGINSDGTGKTKMTNFAAQNLHTQSSFCFTKDTTKIFYYKQSPSSSPTGEIYSANIDFSGETRLTNNSAWDGQPRVSPDGTKVAFVRCDNADGYSYPYNIYVMNSDGTGVSKLTAATGSQFCIDPVWSPDGSKIIYSFNDGVQTDIYFMNADGSAKQNLTITPAYNERVCDWK